MTDHRCLRAGSGVHHGESASHDKGNGEDAGHGEGKHVEFGGLIGVLADAEDYEGWC